MEYLTQLTLSFPNNEQELEKYNSLLIHGTLKVNIPLDTVSIERSIKSKVSHNEGLPPKSCWNHKVKLKYLAF